MEEQLAGFSVRVCSFYTELITELGADENRVVLDPDYQTFCEIAGVLARTA